MTQRKSQSIGPLIACLIISVSVTGYFLGLRPPVKQGSKADNVFEIGNAKTDSQVLPATSYADIGRRLKELRARERTMSFLPSARSPFTNPSDVKMEVDTEQMALALALREQRRAYNGAPPTVPHAIDQLSSESCMVCHAGGARTGSLRIAKLPHPYYANCTQCHVENSSPSILTETFVENSFVGNPAPSGGPRAFPGAPPQIPHSTWMRNECLSCHGFSGHRGIQTTHPWRQNCLQCHTASAQLDQLPLTSEPAFLTPPAILN
jgi:cytochrome c-type protein NapB